MMENMAVNGRTLRILRWIGDNPGTTLNSMNAAWGNGGTRCNSDYITWLQEAGLVSRHLSSDCRSKPMTLTDRGALLLIFLEKADAILGECE